MDEKENYSVSKTLGGIYDNYIDEVLKVHRESKPADGLFGMNKKDEICHDEFARNISKELKTIAQSYPSQAAQALGFIYDAPLHYNQLQSAYLMTVAVHALTEDLIELLTSEQAKALFEKYENDYPHRNRMPAQEKLIKALSKRARSR